MSELLGPAQAGTVVVDAVLVVGVELPVVRLTRTVDPAQAFSLSQARVTGAAVEIRSGGTTYRYGESESNPGLYVAQDFHHVVDPETEYDLYVETAEGESVTARTITPPVLTVDRWVLLEDDGKTVNHQLVTFEEAGADAYNAPENQIVHGVGTLEARFRRPDVPGFQIGLHSLDPNSDFAIDVSFLDEKDLADFKRDLSSPVLILEDGTVRLPWFSLPYQGPYLVELFAVDVNWYDLIRSFPGLNQGGPGFGGSLGDSFDEPLFHVQGGIGLFGSASKSAIGFRILAP